MTHHRFLPLLATCAGIFVAGIDAQANRDDMTPLDVSYQLTVEPDLTTLRIDVDVANICRPTTRVAMPNWTPGAYGIRRHGQRVESLTARSASRGNAEARTLEVEQLDHQTWSIPTEGVDLIRVSYKVKIRPRGPRGPRGDAPKTGMQVSGPGAFLYVVGAKDRPVTIRYHLPDGWDVANGLRQTSDPHIRRAKDYDTFIDAPTILGIFKSYEFDVNGTPFHCVFFQNSQRYEFDMPAFVDVCKQIVNYQGELFGSFPFPDYWFLFTIPGGGGLEHLNSTSIGLNPARMKRDVRDGASVTAHEFFHLWNVKRIRPKTLGPFEYQHENYTGNLWVSEGWTSYYGDLTLVGTGIHSRERFLSSYVRYLSREFNKEARKQHSVYWSSRNVWHRTSGELPRVDYYAKGEILGTLIDLKIRHETDNRKTLDDVVRFMNRWFAERGVGFEEHDVERACTAISNYDFSEFFARHVHGTLDPPTKEIFAYAGIEYTEKHALSTALPFQTRPVGRGWMVTASSSRRPQRGDMIISLDGKPRAQPTAFLAEKKPGDKVRVGIQSQGEDDEIEVSLVKRDIMSPTLRFMDNPTAKQKRILESWLTGK